MVNQLTNTEGSVITNSKGITGSGKITGCVSVMGLEFRLQNTYRVAKLLVKAAGVSASEFHFTGKKQEGDARWDVSANIRKWR